MESQPQNPEFRINPENFHPCIYFMSIDLSIGNISSYQSHRYYLR